MLTRALNGLGSRTSWCTRKFSRKAVLNVKSTDSLNTTTEGVEKSEVESSVAKSPSNVSKGGFAKAIAKMEGHENFPRTIRFSPLIQMGDPQGKIAEGTIVHVVDDDLYIDFGGKFNCVCPRPPKNGSAYTLGKKVRIMIHDLELSTRFLGAKTDLTILEADCSLLGLARSNK